MRILLIPVVCLAVACGGSKPKPEPTGPTPSGDRVLVNVDADGVGLGGHDPVGYATDKAPVPGVAANTSSHGGATYRFASAEHKTTFDADPAKYAPGFGGYCAYAASQNRLSPGDPTVWMMHEGQLLLFTNQEFLDLFKQDPAGHKAKADANWPGLVAQHGK